MEKHLGVKAHRLNEKTAWLAMPLCRHYFSAHFDLQPIRVVAAGDSREVTVIWALGVQPSGEWEVLGAWPAPDAGQAFWRGVFDEFEVRGVERISFVLADAVAVMSVVRPHATVFLPFPWIQGDGQVPTGFGAGVLGAEARRTVREAASVRGARAAFERLLARSESSKATVVATDWPELLAQLEPLYALRSERRALVRRGDEALELLGRSLSRAVGRHGPFADVDAATSFVARTLTHAESQLSLFVRQEVRLPVRRSGVLAARSGVAASGVPGYTSC